MVTLAVFVLFPLLCLVTDLLSSVSDGDELSLVLLLSFFPLSSLPFASSPFSSSPLSLMSAAFNDEL